MSTRVPVICIRAHGLLGALVLITAWLGANERSAMANPTCGSELIPPAALAMGFNQLVIDSCPTPDDVSKDGTGIFEWYNGHQWWTEVQQPDPANYTANIYGQLLIKLGGSITTVTRSMQPGKFPLLPGARGFYVEFTVQLSDNNPDHLPAVWVMPAEHGLGQADHYYPDPIGYERWFELDVDEGGYTAGFMGTALSWQGKWPAYKWVKNNPIWNVPPLDRSQVNTFAAAFQPGSLKVTWWLNGVLQYTANNPAVPLVARKQNFYLIVTANHRGLGIPYQMKLLRARAYVPR